MRRRRSRPPTLLGMNHDHRPCRVCLRRRRETPGYVMLLAASATTNTRRRATRHRVIKGGTISYADKHGTLPCIVRDLSAEGACLRVFNPTIVPDRFTLNVDVDGLRVACRVSWRRRFDVGVAFDAPACMEAPRRPQIVVPLRPAARPQLRRKSRPQAAADHQSITSSPQVVGPDRPAITSIHPPTASDTFLDFIIDLDADVTRACLLVATGTSIADALASDRPGCRPKDFITYYPRESASLMRASSILTRRYPRSALHAAMSAFNGALADAKTATLAFPRLLETGSVAFDPALRDLVPRWRRAAATALRMTIEIDRLLAVHGLTRGTPTTEALTALLAAAIRGEAPLATATCGIALPPWGDRRSEPRLRANIAVTLRTANRSHAVVIRDRTATSLGIDGAPHLDIGTTVELVFGAYLKTTARVVWCDHGRAGLALATAPIIPST